MTFLAAVVVLAAFQTNFYNDGLKALDAQQYQAAAERCGRNTSPSAINSRGDCIASTP